MIRYSADVRNAGLDARIARLGANPKLILFAAPAPPGCAAPNPGNVLVEILLPKEWMSKATDGAVIKRGTWRGTATGRGEPKSFRICGADGACGLQGEIPFDLTLDEKNSEIEPGQNVLVVNFGLSSGNA